MHLTELLEFAIQNNASDLHLSSGLPPMIRIAGDLHPRDLPPIADAELIKIVNELLDEQQQKEFTETLEIDFSFEIAGLARFRVNFFNQLRGMAAVFRIIPATISTFSDLCLPPVFEEIASFRNGLVLITGATGSGKSTTMAAIADFINSTRHEHILTVEDPVEFVHQSKKCLVNQREVHRNTHSFSAALRSGLREDPDIILVGELRDLETIRLALTAAETGHLVFGTLHTNSAIQTINRIIDVFPAAEKSMVRSMLSDSLQAIVAQRLLKKNGGGRVAALEIMMFTGAIRNLIHEDKIAQIYSFIQTGQAKGMRTLDQHLTELVQQDIISLQVAREAANDKTLF